MRKRERAAYAWCIFDLNGVLTDTAEYHYQGWQRLADALGILFDRERNEAVRGVSRCRSLELLLAGRVYPEERMLELMERTNRTYQVLLTQVLPQDLFKPCHKYRYMCAELIRLYSRGQGLLSNV